MGDSDAKEECKKDYSCLVMPIEATTSKLASCITLPHPKTTESRMFTWDDGEGSGGNVCEVRCVTPAHGTWFIDNHVQPDGSLYVCTPIDITFLILPFIHVASKSGKFTPLDHILIDPKHPHLNSHVFNRKDINNYVSNVAESKECGDLTVFRYDEMKAMRYLGNKVLSVFVRLQSLKGSHQEPATILNTSAVSGAGGGISIADNAKDATTLLEAHALVSEYLNDELSNGLFDYLGLIVDDVNNADTCDEPLAKKAKSNGDPTNGVSEPSEDYSKDMDSKKGKNTGSVTVLSNKQKALKKTADRQGIRSISSFFTKK